MSGTDTLPIVWTLAGALLLVAGVSLLRARWRSRGEASRAVTFAAWALVVAAFGAFSEAWGGELGVSYALLALSAAGFALVATNVEFRVGRGREARGLALEPEDRPTNWPRAIAKSLLAIVLAGVAAIGIGVAFAVAGPLDIVDRVVVGGLLVPALWGGGMAWTLADAKLLRATVLLIAVSALAYGIAFLPKLLS